MKERNTYYQYSVSHVDFEEELVDRFNKQYGVSIYNATKNSATRGAQLVPIGIHVPTICLCNT